LVSNDIYSVYQTEMFVYTENVLSCVRLNQCCPRVGSTRGSGRVKKYGPVDNLVSMKFINCGKNW